MSEPVAVTVGGEVPLTPWRKFRLVLKVVELRLRFIAIMAITGLTFAYWDEIGNRFDKWQRPAGHARTSVSGFEHFCPMHPQVTQEAPGSCPICGMPLAKRKQGTKAPLGEGVTARVELSSHRVEQAGIKTAEVGYSPLKRTLSTVGYVAFDERLLANVISKAPGRTRVEKLWVNTTGEKVEVGQTLAELYSPELSQAVQELISISRRMESASGTSAGLANSRAEMLKATTEKLKRWGLTEAQVGDIVKRGKSDFMIPIQSPVKGFVFKKNVVQGQEVPEGFAMFEVADLETVWVQAQVFEHQLAMVQEGQAVEAKVEAFPGETFTGRVEYIPPRLDPATRAVEARVVLANPGRRLLPGMFATVMLTSPWKNTSSSQSVLAANDQKTCPVTRLKLGAMGEPVAAELEGKKVWTCCDACLPKLKARPAYYLDRLKGAPADQVLSVPESAVIDTGTRKVVYVETEPGVFEGREVILGPRLGDRYPVIEGLMPGENVAARGAFLIDAESRINPGVGPDIAPPVPAKSPKSKDKDDSPKRDAPIRSASLTDMGRRNQ